MKTVDWVRTLTDEQLIEWRDKLGGDGPEGLKRLRVLEEMQSREEAARKQRERIYNAVATVLDAEYAVRQNWGLSSLHDEAAGAAADAAMAVLAGKAVKP